MLAFCMCTPMVAKTIKLANEWRKNTPSEDTNQVGIHTMEEHWCHLDTSRSIWQLLRKPLGRNSMRGPSWDCQNDVISSVDYRHAGFTRRISVFIWYHAYDTARTTFLLPSLGLRLGFKRFNKYYLFLYLPYLPINVQHQESSEIASSSISPPHRFPTTSSLSTITSLPKQTLNIP